jgi:hypothetical protein
MSDIIRSVRAELTLGNRTIDCYLFPNGEKRIGIVGAGIAIGRGKDFLGRLLKSESEVLKSLLGLGFSGTTQDSEIKKARGTTRSKTISSRDFTKLITWDAVVNNNQDSIILLAAFAETGLDDILEKVFTRQSLDFLLEKIVHYSKWTMEDLQEALDANNDDWRVIREQEQFLLDG